jgi:hypothetical protein
MAEPSSSARAMLTAFCSAEHSEAAARRTGVVQRTSKLTGRLLLALVTCGVWGDAKTTRAPVAAKVAPLRQPGAVSPEALDQRLNHRALAFLPDVLRTTWAKIPAGHQGCDERLLAPFARGHMADSTGFERPDRRNAMFPGAGGSAAPAGAKIHLVWDDHQRVVTHVARMPWNVPEQQ